MNKLTIGDQVLHNGKEARVVATSGKDLQCIVQYKDSNKTSGWIKQELVWKF